METQTRLSRHNKFISAENIVGIFSVSSSSGRPKNEYYKAVFKATEPNPVSNTQRVSGELSNPMWFVIFIFSKSMRVWGVPLT